MTRLSIRLPDSLHQHARRLAAQEGISVNQLISQALAEKLSALATEDYLSERARRGGRAAFEAALALVPDVPPQPGDEPAEPPPRR